jgi:hypothetical protein
VATAACCLGLATVSRTTEEPRAFRLVERLEVGVDQFADRRPAGVGVAELLLDVAAKHADHLPVKGFVDIGRERGGDGLRLGHRCILSCYAIVSTASSALPTPPLPGFRVRSARPGNVRRKFSELPSGAPSGQSSPGGD